MDSDKYKTIKEKAISEGYYSEKRSKFLAFAHHVDSVEEALEIVKEYRKKYYDARHCCYAYRVGLLIKYLTILAKLFSLLEKGKQKNYVPD